LKSFYLSYSTASKFDFNTEKVIFPSARKKAHDKKALCCEPLSANSFLPRATLFVASLLVGRREKGILV
jgi:hypothetical protein